MVTIVTGKIDSGKTTYLLRRYEAVPSGDGFLAEKRMEGKSICGFTLVRLSNKERLPWMIHQNFYRGEYDDAERFGPYFFKRSTLKIVEASVDDMIARGVSPIYLDEVGVLELNGGGYDQAIKKILRARLSLCIATREDLAPKIIDHYQIEECELIDVERER